MKKKKETSKLTIGMIAAGALLIGFAAGNGIANYRANHMPLDVADTSISQLDQQNNFIPRLEPATKEYTGIPTLAVAATGSSPAVTPTPTPATGLMPDRIRIPSINLNAPITPVHFKLVDLNDQTYEQWLVPNKFSAGWQDTSALLGVPGNTVLNGHHNEYGKVFGGLITLNPGDSIEIYSGTTLFKYVISQKLILPERFQSIDRRITNAQWIMPTSDERLTLVTCWPENTNTFRLIIVALPEK